jgi:lysyl-tRNA synthetase class 2
VLRSGDLVVVEGVKSGNRLTRARIADHFSQIRASDDSEFHRLHTLGVGRSLRARAAAAETVRAYFRRMHFVEVQTPVRVAAPGLDAYVDAIRADGGFLITSPEHHMKRLLVGGMPRIFQFAHCSRAGEQGHLHEPEFSMLEWYRAFADVGSVIADTEQIVHRVVDALANDHKIVLGRSIDVTPPFDRMTIAEAFRAYARVQDVVDLAASDEDRYFQIFVDSVEPALARHPRPLFLTEFPISQAALARPCPQDPAFAERFELVIAGVELCNGFGELSDPTEQRRRFEKEQDRRRRARAPAQPIDEKLLGGLAEGLPPSAGNALGFDRLVALALGTRRIADVMTFPSTRA